jgi:hypothetical protein
MPRGIPKSGKRAPWGSKTRNFNNFNPEHFTHVEMNNVAVVVESDEEIDARLNERFEVLQEITQSAIDGDVRALIVSGPAGLGKSYEVEQKLIENSIPDDCIVKGYVRAPALYKLLYRNHREGDVLVLDDADTVLFDDTSMSFLKAVLDSSDRRTVSYLTEGRLIDEENAELLPKSFQFNGAVILITNLDFDEMIARNHKMTPHFEALISRAHYIDMMMKNKRDYLIRIKQVVSKGLFRKTGLDEKGETDVMDFIYENQDTIRELSIRMALKIAACRKKGSNWERVARVTCCRN